MRSSGKAALTVVAAALLSCAVPSRAIAQAGARTRYEGLQAAEARVTASTRATADDFRVVVNGYWNLVRRYPNSGYADNALWQAANLSTEAFRRFGEDRDKYRAVQLFQWLRNEYPHSSYRSKATTLIEELETPSETMIRALHREVLPEVVRVTIELDREVPFYSERLEGPARLFFDLKGTKTVESLLDATLRYDSGIVRQIRLGRHPNSTTRVVLDLENAGRYSIFTLYNPYRIVIDVERAAGDKPAVLAASAETPGTINTPASAPSPDLPAGKPVVPSANAGGKFSVARQLGLGVSRIVLDAGHGGHDPGASAFGLSEAELVLDVTLRLEKLLQKQPGTDVVLTRRTNEYLGLEARTAIANRESADLFLSIHANASANSAARGVETYFLNFALNPQAEAVAARENAASTQTMNSLPRILKAITLNNKLDESRDFAASVQRALVRELRPSNRALRDLGVKQAPFMVLIGASMPSVLAEISFVTNRQEARLLKTPAYRQKIAEALLAGILKYQQSLKKVATN